MTIEDLDVFFGKIVDKLEHPEDHSLILPRYMERDE